MRGSVEVSVSEDKKVYIQTLLHFCLRDSHLYLSALLSSHYKLTLAAAMHPPTILSLSFLTLLSFSTATPTPLKHLPRQCTGPSVNAATVALIKEFEGFVASPEPDPIGLPTVGYGHLCQTSGCAEVPYSFPLTTTTASQLLASDLKVRLPM